MLSLALLMLLPAAQAQVNPLITCGGSSEPAAITQSAEGQVFRCTGGADVKYQDVHVEADWIEFDAKTKQVNAGDKVRFTRGPETLRGGRLSFNLESKTGTFSDASGQIEGFYVKTGDLERLPDGRWHLIRPSATACSGDCPRWRFTFSEATIRPGKTFSGKNLVFRAQNLPVFWLPKIAFPTESRTRSTGFLIPGTSTSTTKGRSFRESFFWAINRSYDALITGEYMSKRGPAGSVEFRALPNASTNIFVGTFFAIDRLGQGGHRTDVRMKTSFKENWRGVADVDITSSFPFRQVYEEGFDLISSPIEQSLAFLTNNGPRSSFNVLYNRKAVFFPDSPSVALRRFPSIEYQRSAQSLSGKLPAYFGLEGSVTGMARRDDRVETPAMMQRIDIHPTVEIPALKTAPLTWSHRFGVRDTFYTHSLNPSAVQRSLNRGVFEYSSSVVGPQMERRFKSWKHIVEPTITYRYVAGVDRFRQTVVVDETDLVTDTNEIEYGVTQHFFAGHEFLNWRIAQKLYFDPNLGGALLPGRRNALEPLLGLSGFAYSDGVPRRFSPIVSTLRIATTPWTSTDIEVDYDTKREEFRSAGILGEMNRGLVNASVGYFFNKSTDIQAANNQLRTLVTYGSQTRLGVSAGIGFSYDVGRRLFQGSTAQVYYNAECYGLALEFTQYNIGARIESRLRFSLSLKNIGAWGTQRPQERLF